MKLYRYVKLNEINHTLFSHGYENEGLNLIKNGLMAPSYRYLDLVHTSSFDTLANNFPKENEMTKYFFLSLQDTIDWAYKCYRRDLDTFNTLYEYAILEVDIKEELIKFFIGCGYYDNKIKTEARIPYNLLFNSLNQEENNIFTKALEIYNLSYQRFIFPWNKIIRQFIKENKSQNKDIYQKGANKLYPYLCFPINTSYQILYPNHDYNWLNKINEYSKEKLNNEEMKLVLIKNGYNFESRKN